MIRVGLSWILYWMGDLVFETIVKRTLGHYFEWPYRVYSQLMKWSLDVQGDDPRGPWREPEPR